MAKSCKDRLFYMATQITLPKQTMVLIRQTTGTQRVNGQLRQPRFLATIWSRLMAQLKANTTHLLITSLLFMQKAKINRLTQVTSQLTQVINQQTLATNHQHQATNRLTQARHQIFQTSRILTIMCHKLQMIRRRTFQKNQVLSRQLKKLRHTKCQQLRQRKLHRQVSLLLSRHGKHSQLRLWQLQHNLLNKPATTAFGQPWAL